MNLFILSFKTARKPISLLSRTTLPVLWMSPAEHISFMYQHVVMQIVQCVQSNLLHIKTWRFIFRCTFGSAVDGNIFVYNKYIQCFFFCEQINRFLIAGCLIFCWYLGCFGLICVRYICIEDRYIFQLFAMGKIIWIAWHNEETCSYSRWERNLSLFLGVTNNFSVCR